MAKLVNILYKKNKSKDVGATLAVILNKKGQGQALPQQITAGFSL